MVTRRYKNHAEEAKPNILSTLIIKPSCKTYNYKMYICKNFGIKVTNSTIEALIIYKNNNNTLWADDIFN